MLQILEVITYKRNHWDTIDDLHVPVQILLEAYTKVYFKLHDTVTRSTRQYLLQSIPNINQCPPELCLDDLLLNYTVDLGQRITPIKSFLRPKTISYANAFDYNLKIDAGNTIAGYAHVTENYAPDITISANSVTPNLINTLANNVLFTINGMVHFPILQNGNLNLVNGMSHLNNDEYRRHLGIIDFSEFSGISVIPFTETSIVIHPFNPTKKTTSVTVTTQESMVGKTPLLVINRMLCLPNTIYKSIGDNSLIVNLDHVWLVSNIKNVENNNWVSPANIAGDGFNIDSIDISKVLANVGSAIVLINTEDIGIITESLLRTNTPGVYTYNGKPTGIAIGIGMGVLDYVYTTVTSFGTEVLTGRQKFGIEKLVDTVPESLLTGIDNSNLNSNSQYHQANIVTLYSL